MPALLASCTMLVQPEDNTAPEVGSSTDAVDFNVYVNRGISSKAGWAGDLTTDALKTADAGGFGVFGYYTNGVLYNATSKPDFMYNQQVTYSGSAWTYSPVKYWPNEFGASASSQASDRLTFFAYAPYAAADPLTGLVTGDKESGIISMTRNIASGDPLVMYSASLKPGSGVDLCWGVAGADFTSSVDGNNNQVSKGDPYKDLIKPKTGDKISFEFNHALAQLNVQIDADIDAEGHTASNPLADKTRIYVRSVTFTGFTTQGALNLNSQAGKPSWYDLTGTGRLNREPVTIYDGRTDGLEGASSAADWNEKPTGLNPAVVQDGTDKDGVTNTAVNLFDSNSADAPVMVIPTAGVPLKVTIVYDVETEDPNLPGLLSDGATHGISLENTITKTVTLSGSTEQMNLVSGNKYVLKLHLGMTSVKMDAEVAAWDDTSHTADVDLPINTTGLGSITLTDTSGDPVTAVSGWPNGSVTAPTVKVFSDDGMDITTQVQITYSSSDDNVASVSADGSVTLNGAGTATITVTATHNQSTITATYDVNVNLVTAISVAPSTGNIMLGGTVDLIATLEINGGNGVNGTITTLPTITWTSDYEKVTVAATGDPSVSGSTIVANAIATAATDAVENHQAKVKASVGTPYASSTIEGTSTLTCLAKVSIKSVDLSAESTTVWFNEGASLPTVTVMGTDDQVLTTGITLAWTAKNPEVATYDSASGITLVKSGIAVFEVTATLAESSTTAASTKTAEYTVYVNKVNSIVVTPASSNLVVGTTPAQTKTLTATLTYNDGSASPLGTVTSWPTVTWSSSDACITINPSTGTASATSPSVETVASLGTGAAAGQSSTITATVGDSFVKAPVSGTATVNCVAPVTIQTVDLSLTSTTVWKADNTVTTPTITKVTGSDGSDLTGVANVTWSYGDSSIAEVAAQGGAITLKAAGVIQIVATVSIPVSEASPAGDSKVEYYTVNSNEVTSLAVDPTSATVAVNGTVDIGTNIEMTHNGDWATLFLTTTPPVTWNSATPAYVTVNPSATGLAAEATGIATGSSAVTATIPAAYVNAGTDLTATCTVTCSNATSATGNGFTGGWN